MTESWRPLTPPRAFSSVYYAVAPRQSSVPRPAWAPLNAADIPIFTSRALTPGALAVGGSDGPAAGRAPGRGAGATCAQTLAPGRSTLPPAAIPVVRPRKRRLSMSARLLRRFDWRRFDWGRVGWAAQRRQNAPHVEHRHHS